MGDLITDAIERTDDTQERSASGTVDGRSVTLKKETYRVHEHKTAWRVAVYFKGKSRPTSKKSDRSATEAQELFQMLVNKHDLTE